jgi:NAD(P)-dependent dehydrogenase (short-subunit alcohol dehydrogenase family)
LSTSLLLEQAQRREARLKFLPNPDELECAFDSSSICLLTDDGSWLSLQVAQSLIQRGWKVVVLSFPKFVIPESNDWPDTIASFALVDLSEGHLQQQLEAIERQYGSIRAFIHLNPVNVTAQTAKSLLKQVFLIAKQLKKSLNAATQLGRSWFVTALHLDGHLGTGKTTEFEPIVGGFLGLTKTLNLEWERVFCRSIDFSRELETEVIVRSLLAELFDPNRLLVEVGYSRQGRVTLVAEPETMPISPIITTHSISPDSVFLVSGGGRGITAKCAIALAQSYPCKFILLGRSSLDPEPIWAQGCLTEDGLKQNAIANLSQTEKPTPAKIQKLVKSILAQREIAQTLHAIAQAGGQAEYLSVDITNVSDLQAKLTPVLQIFGNVTGIVHGAGVLADKLIEHKSAADFEVVYTTKIEGLKSILACVNIEQINHLVLFSSAAGFYGNVGQSDYAIANEILNKFAHNFKRQHRNCQVISFNWGPWESGMVTPELKQLFAQRGVEVIPVEVGTQVFVNQLITGNSETVQVLVGSALVTPSVALESDLKTYRIRRKLTREANPFLEDHVIGGNPVLPAAFSVAWLVNIAEALYFGYKFFHCQKYKILKGIVFDETLADEYIVDLQEIKKNCDLEIELIATIWSETSKGKMRYHYQSNLTLVREIPKAPVYEKLDHQKQEQQIINSSPYQDGTLFHGSSFQGVKSVLKITPEKLTMECILPKVNESYYGQFSAKTFNPIAADIQLQCMLIGTRHFYDAAGLPSRCQKGEHFQNIPFGKPFYVSMEVQSSSETKLVADVTAHDREGKIYSRVFGQELTISKQLNSLFLSVKNQDTTNFIPFWRKFFGVEHPVAEGLYSALYRRFVNKVVLEDTKEFYSLDGKPKLYLANHQVGIESILFVFAISALSNSIIHTVAKVEHQQSWVSELSSHIYSYPQLKNPELILYFDRDNQLSMLKLLSSLKKVIPEQRNSLLVHVQGTRALSCRQPVKDLSAVFIDLALELNIPIIPVKFVGGLPVEPLETRLEFPVGYTYQNYHLGKAIYPETLKAMGNVERKSLILERLNQLGGIPEKCFPHPPNLNFEREVQLWMKQSGVSEMCAVLYKVLEEIPNPTEEIRTLLAGIRQGKIEVSDSPEDIWLEKFGKWLSQG